MKFRVLFFLLNFTLCITGHSQTVSRILNYKASSLTTVNGVNTYYNDTLSYIYNENGDYLLYSSKDSDSFSLYKSKLNTLFTFSGDIASSRDVSSDTEEDLLGAKPSIILTDSVSIIQNYKCKSVIVKWKTGEYIYYYAPDFLPIDPILYKNYNYDQWGAYLKISKSLPMKISKIIYGLNESSIELINYKETESLNPSIFNVPKLKEIKNYKGVIPSVKYYTIQKWKLK